MHGDYIKYCADLFVLYIFFILNILNNKKLPRETLNYCLKSKQLRVVKFSTYLLFKTGVNPGYEERGGGGEIQKGGRVADITRK